MLVAVLVEDPPGRATAKREGEVGTYTGTCDMKKLLTIALLIAMAAATTVGEVKLVRKDGKWVRRAAPAKGTPAGEAALIQQKIDRGKYRSAVKAAKKFLKRYPTSPLREEVLGLAGEAELRRKRYWQAYEWYEQQLIQFPSGEHFEQALEKEMQIAEAFLAGKKRIALRIFHLPARQEGIDILQGVAGHAPSSPHAESALLTIGEYHFNKGDWTLAIEAYEQFLKLLPKSSRAPHAELALAEASLRSYRGPMWEETPLIEAQQRYKAFAKKYPSKARKAQVENILKEIHSSRAEKQYETGRFYIRTDKPRAAAYYFGIVVREYSDTDWSKRAQAKLDKINPPTKSSDKTGKKPEPTTEPSDIKDKKENKS